MNPASDSLNLRDIHLPSTISWWPPAPGWWLLLGGILLLLAIAFIVHRYRQRRQLRRAAAQELTKIQTAYAQSADAQQLVQTLSIWLRRVSLSFYPRHEVAGLTGTAWLEFLDRGLADSKQDLRFNTDIGLVLLSAPYRQTARVDAQTLLQLCQQWLSCLSRHRRRLR